MKAGPWLVQSHFISRPTVSVWGATEGKNRALVLVKLQGRTWSKGGGSLQAYFLSSRRPSGNMGRCLRAVGTTGLGGRPLCGKGPSEDPLGRLVLTVDYRPAIPSGLS